MNKKIAVLFLFAIVFPLKAQDKIEQIDNQLTFKTWVDLESREINGFKVTRINGADYGNRRNAATGMITSIAYNDSLIEGQSPFLEFFITRYEQSLANMRWFTIILRSEEDDEKIFEKKLDYKAAQLPEGSYFWNYTTIYLPDGIDLPFFVYIKDQNILDLTSFKFKIEELP